MTKYRKIIYICLIIAGLFVETRGQSDKYVPEIKVGVSVASVRKPTLR